MTDTLAHAAAEQKYRELRRTQIIQELGALEDLMIALGELKERTIAPHRKQEYFENPNETTVTTTHERYFSK